MMAGMLISVGQIIRYGGIGVLLNGTGYVLYLIVTSFGAGHKATMTVIYASVLLIGFFANQKIAFKYDGDTGRAAVRFFCANLLGYAVNLLILLVFVDKLGLPHEIVQIFAILVVAIFNFLLLRFFVFS